jgi:hypothetical protein
MWFWLCAIFVREREREREREKQTYYNIVRTRAKYNQNKSIKLHSLVVIFFVKSDDKGIPFVYKPFKINTAYEIKKEAKNKKTGSGNTIPTRCEILNLLHSLNLKIIKKYDKKSKSLHIICKEIKTIFIYEVDIVFNNIQPEYSCLQFLL